MAELVLQSFDVKIRNSIMQKSLYARQVTCHISWTFQRCHKELQVTLCYRNVAVKEARLKITLRNHAQKVGKPFAKEKNMETGALENGLDCSGCFLCAISGYRCVIDMRSDV